MVVFGYSGETIANTNTGDQFFSQCTYQDINKQPAKQLSVQPKEITVVTIQLHDCPIALSYRYKGFGARINQQNDVFNLHGEINNYCAYNSFNAEGAAFTMLCLKN